MNQSDSLKEKDPVTEAMTFGVKVRKKDGLFLTRDNYCKVEKRSSLGRDNYTDDWCEWHYANCMENFDLNMDYLAALNADDFRESIKEFLRQNPNFIEIQNLNKVKDIKGYYLMVLDEYKQSYIGTTTNMKQRIMSHWSKTKPFDRLLWPIGNVQSSILSIDSYRALDTTRIFAWMTDHIYSLEDHFINRIPERFITNRIGGGLMPAGLEGFMQARSTMKTRNLTEQADSETIVSRTPDC